MKVSEFLMPYVLSRLIYNVSGKGEMRVGVRARRHELGAHPLLPLTDGETEARGEGQWSHVMQSAGLQMPSAAPSMGGN